MKKQRVLIAKVKSKSDGRKVYQIIRAAKGYLSCSCLAHRFTKLDSKGQKPPCKHIRELQLAISR